MVYKPIGLIGEAKLCSWSWLSSFILNFWTFITKKSPNASARSFNESRSGYCYCCNGFVSDFEEFPLSPSTFMNFFQNNTLYLPHQWPICTGCALTCILYMLHFYRVTSVRQHRRLVFLLSRKRSPGSSMGDLRAGPRSYPRPGPHGDLRPGPRGDLRSDSPVPSPRNLRRGDTLLPRIPESSYSGRRRSPDGSHYDILPPRTPSPGWSRSVTSDRHDMWMLSTILLTYITGPL